MLSSGLTLGRKSISLYLIYIKEDVKVRYTVASYCYHHVSIAARAGMVSFKEVLKVWVTKHTTLHLLLTYYFMFLL